jgi:hypothetical protein
LQHGIPRTWAADQAHVFGSLKELASMKLAEQSVTQVTGREVEGGQILVCRVPTWCRHWSKAHVGGAAFMWSAVDRTSRSAISALSSCDRIGMQSSGK